MKNITIEFNNNDTINTCKEKLKSIADRCREIYSADDFIVLSNVIKTSWGEEIVICDIFKNFIEANNAIINASNQKRSIATISYFNLSTMQFKMIARKQRDKTEYVYENNHYIFDLKDDIIERIVDQLTSFNLDSSININY